MSKAIVLLAIFLIGSHAIPQTNFLKLLQIQQPATTNPEAIQEPVNADGEETAGGALGELQALHPENEHIGRMIADHERLTKALELIDQEHELCLQAADDTLLMERVVLGVEEANEENCALKGLANDRKAEAAALQGEFQDLREEVNSIIGEVEDLEADEGGHHGFIQMAGGPPANVGQGQGQQNQGGNGNDEADEHDEEDETDEADEHDEEDETDEADEEEEDEDEEEEDEEEGLEISEPEIGEPLPEEIDTIIDGYREQKSALNDLKLEAKDLKLIYKEIRKEMKKICKNNNWEEADSDDADVQTEVAELESEHSENQLSCEDFMTVDKVLFENELAALNARAEELLAEAMYEGDSGYEEGYEYETIET